MKETWRYVLAFVLLLIATGARGEIAEAFVAKFYPDSLTTISGDPVPLKDRKVVFVVGSLAKGGPSLIVAVFSSSTRGAVSVISPTAEGTVLATAAPDGMLGFAPSVDLVDFDTSGDRLIVVRIQHSRGFCTAWLFKWTGSTLRNISPAIGTTPDDDDTDLTEPTFLDLDGTGHISIVDFHFGRLTSDDGTETSHRQFRVFRYVDGHIEQSGPDPDHMAMFSRGKGAPVMQTETFDVADPARAREIVIVNGGDSVTRHDNGGGSARVSSAEVTLNGQPIATPDDFNGKTKVIRLAVHLKDHNELRVKINGAPDSTLAIVVIPK